MYGQEYEMKREKKMKLLKGQQYWLHFGCILTGRFRFYTENCYLSE